jgi:hypothetical protein
MPIITQLNATKLRSLKYGNDTSDGGNSGQPYVKTELKDLDKPLTRIRLTKFDDGLIRGGAIGALNASIVDTIRIGKFLKDLPKGPLFIAKQVGLQLSNPKLETKKGLGGLLGSTRLYNLGINTLRQIPLTAFGEHITRHGLFPVTDDSIKYIKVVAENNKNSDNNRLVALTDKFNLGDNIGGVGEDFDLQEERRENRAANREGRQANRAANREGRQANRAANRERRQANRATNQLLRQYSKEFGGDFFREKFIRTDFDRTNFKRNKLDVKALLSQFTIDSYIGGPNSLYGIGRTTINRHAFTEDKRKINDAFAESFFQTIRGSISFNPLTEQSRFETSPEIWTTGSISSPLSPQYPLNKIVETDQFKALGRKPDNGFFYSAGVSTSKLQGDIGDGLIFVADPVNSTPAVNPTIEAPFDKFSTIKYNKENTEYIGGYREVIIGIEKTGSFEIEKTGNYRTGSQTFTSKISQADADKQLTNWEKEVSELDTVVVSSGKSTKKNLVKASIVNVNNILEENKLRPTYDNGEMADSPITEINQENFRTEEIIIDRDPKIKSSNKPSFHYFSGRDTISNFNRVDRDIMLVSFDTIDPFTATDARNVVFSAYLSGFKYNSNSTWNPVKYVGRSESFYTFTEHKRDVSFNIQIPCFNKTHLFEKHRALSELQSAGAGKYDSNNRLGGIITKVTLGNYLVSEPGILTSISFDIPDVSSWDIDEKLAMYINAQFSFTIIGKELPTYKEGGFLNYLPNPISGTGYLTGAQAR